MTAEPSSGARPEVDLVALRSLAEKATPGPWNHDGPYWWDKDDCVACVTSADRRVLVAPGTARKLNENTDHDSAYIAAVSPDVLLSLLDRLRRAESIRTLVFRAADKGQNMQPPGEHWTDDQASTVEHFAQQLLREAGWFDDWLSGVAPEGD